MSDGVVRGQHGHGHHEMREFSIHGEVRKEVNKTSHMDFQRAGFACSGHWFREPLGKQPLKTEWLDIVLERNLKGSGAGCTYVPKDKAGRKESSLDEQGPSARVQRRKESL